MRQITNPMSPTLRFRVHFQPEQGEVRVPVYAQVTSGIKTAKELESLLAVVDSSWAMCKTILTSLEGGHTTDSNIQILTELRVVVEGLRSVIHNGPSASPLTTPGWWAPGSGRSTKDVTFNTPLSILDLMMNKQTLAFNLTILYASLRRVHRHGTNLHHEWVASTLKDYNPTLKLLMRDLNDAHCAPPASVSSSGAAIRKPTPTLATVKALQAAVISAAAPMLHACVSHFVNGGLSLIQISSSTGSNVARRAWAVVGSAGAGAGALVHGAWQQLASGLTWQRTTLPSQKTTSEILEQCGVVIDELNTSRTYNSELSKTLMLLLVESRDAQKELTTANALTLNAIAEITQSIHTLSLIVERQQSDLAVPAGAPPVPLAAPASAGQSSSQQRIPAARLFLGGLGGFFDTRRPSAPPNLLAAAVPGTLVAREPDNQAGPSTLGDNSNRYDDDPQDPPEELLLYPQLDSLLCAYVPPSISPDETELEEEKKEDQNPPQSRPPTYSALN